MAPNVTVQFLKYDGGIHWRHDLIDLGSDTHGRWLGGPRGTTLQRGREPEIVWESPVVLLVPESAWWAAFFDEGGKYEIYVDVTAGASWVTEDGVEMVDLDLDVVRYTEGGVEVLDEDELVEHSAAMAYPPQIIDGARNTAAELVLALEANQPPFDEAAYRPWLEMVT